MAATATSKTNKKTKTPKLSVPKDATYATGRRKEASARVWIFPGKGQITVNGRTFDDYFPRDILRIVATQPLVTTETLSKFDIFCTVKGSGISGQSQAIRHGISRALVANNEALRPTLKQNGFLTRDSRSVERKKPGQRKARAKFQFSKR